jgi:CubicO group peptidase (beta-lactamase class C family)
MLTAPQSHGRAYCFDVSSAYSWVKGAHASPNAFCHTGYTGTSLVCDPDAGTYLILLSDKNKQMAEAVGQKMTYVELNAEPKYMNEYTASLFLPHTDASLFPSVERKDLKN